MCVVAIDGPGGSGKSSVSRGVARHLAWAHLDTGAMYRMATMLVLGADADPTDGEQVLAAVRSHRLEVCDGIALVDGSDVSQAIRSDEVTANVSAVSAHPTLRAWLVRLQQFWVAAHVGTVAEGRDMGSVVFPLAPVKIFLTADPAERARRRAGETGDSADQVERALHRRDKLDSTRHASPLQQPADSISVDTTHLNLDEVIETALSICEAAGIHSPS